MLMVGRGECMLGEAKSESCEAEAIATRSTAGKVVELSWQQVHSVHGSLAGIATKNGTVRSLLANQMKDGAYADEIRHDVIFYRVTSQTNPRSVRCLTAMIGKATAFVVFEKVGTNRWLSHGEWIAVDAAAEDEGTVFLLNRAP